MGSRWYGDHLVAVFRNLLNAGTEGITEDEVNLNGVSKRPLFFVTLII